MNKKRGAIFVLFVLFIINSVYFLYLQDNDNNTEQYRQEVLPEADIFEEIELDKTGEYTVYAGYSNEDLVGYVLLITEEGYRSDIDMIIGVTTKNKIVGIKILKQKETRSRGAHILEPIFLNQFVGLNDSWDRSVDAISGATISSEAVALGVEKAIEFAKNFNVDIT